MKGGDGMKIQRYTRSGNRTLCFLEVKHDLIFIGCGEHENEGEGKRLAHEDALRKAKIISIKTLAMYRLAKQRRRV